MFLINNCFVFLKKQKWIYNMLQVEQVEFIFIIILINFSFILLGFCLLILFILKYVIVFVVFYYSVYKIILQLNVNYLNLVNYL